jgi:hypothetical protein
MISTNSDDEFIKDCIMDIMLMKKDANVSPHCYMRGRICTIFFLIAYIPFSLFSWSFNLEEVECVMEDPELSELWNSLDNIYKPSFRDYQAIENYLKFGRRPYLDDLFKKSLHKGEKRSNIFSNRVLQNLCLKAPDTQKVLFNRKVIGVEQTDKSRCIVLYASHNKDNSPGIKNSYENRLFDIIAELRKQGFKGHVLYRVGSYPLVNRGGLRLAHVPYSFKVLALIEASILGYEDVLWLDCALHPCNDLSDVFSAIKHKGVFLLNNGSTLGYDYHFKYPSGLSLIPQKAVLESGVSVSDLSKIPHIIATAIGVSFKSQKGHDLIEAWYNLTSLTHPSMTLYPEEFILGIAAWKTRNKSIGEVGNYFNVRSAMPNKPKKSKKPFWFDKG